MGDVCVSRQKGYTSLINMYIYADLHTLRRRGPLSVAPQPLPSKGGSGYLSF